MSDYDVGHYIQLYKRRYGLTGTVNKNNLRLLCDPFSVHWSALHYVDDCPYQMGMYPGCEISTRIGTMVKINCGKLKGHQLGLVLPLHNFPNYIRRLVNDPIQIDLSQSQTDNTFVYDFIVGDTQLYRNQFATFRCVVELRGKVTFNTWLTTDDVKISEIVPNTKWMVEGICEFHLGLNDSLRWL